jgi:hypothetical protein
MTLAAELNRKRRRTKARRQAAIRLNRELGGYRTEREQAELAAIFARHEDTGTQDRGASTPCRLRRVARGC